MSHGFETIGDLLEVMDGSETDVLLQGVRADVTKDYAFLTVFDWSGTALFQSGTLFQGEGGADFQGEGGAEVNPIWIESLKKTTLVHLEKMPVIHFYFPSHEDGPDLDVLGIRLDSTIVLIAWVSQDKVFFSEEVVVPEKVTKLVEALVGQVYSDFEENNRLATRIGHFRAEQKALWDSQAGAMKQAFEEREQRSLERKKYIKQLQSVMRMAGDAIITLDENGVIQSFNDEAVRMFGYQRDEAIGVSVDQLLQPMVPSSWDSNTQAKRVANHDPLNLCDSLADYESVLQGKRLEFQGVHKQGAYCPVELTISEVVLDDRRIFTVILRDISARKEAELFQRQLYHTQKLETIGKLAAEMAHEINTPTQYIGENILFLQKACDTFGGPLRQLIRLATLSEADRSKETPKALQQIVESLDAEVATHLLAEMPLAIEQSQEGVRRVVRLVQSMKEFSHPDSEEKQAVDINRVLKNTLAVAKGEWRYVATVETDFQEDLPLVPAFEGECNQVFLNLVVNAAQAVGKRYAEEIEVKGVIKIQTRLIDNEVEVLVSDNGAGISPEIQGRVFNPFFTTKAVGEGTGQGLAIAHSVVAKRHGGSLSFETEPGKGTTFVVRLPLGNNNP